MQKIVLHAKQYIFLRVKSRINLFRNRLLRQRKEVFKMERNENKNQNNNQNNNNRSNNQNSNSRNNNQNKNENSNRNENKKDCPRKF